MAAARSRRDSAICGWRLGRQRISRRARRGCFARCGGRVFRALRGATGALPLETAIWAVRRPLARVVGEFGLFAVRWQEWSARDFSSGQGAGSQPYCMYGKKPQRSPGGKGPASTADTRTVNSPPKEKTRVRLLTFCFFIFFSSPTRSRWLHGDKRPDTFRSGYTGCDWAFYWGRYPDRTPYDRPRSGYTVPRSA